jgi:SagB-type dehydrogenase family enzyme
MFDLYTFHKKTYPGTLAHISTSTAPIPRIKTYDRFPQVTLPITPPRHTSLDQALSLRISPTGFSSDEPLSLENLAYVLTGLQEKEPCLGTDGNVYPKRNYPSAGALAALEVYILNRNVTSLKASSYHYRPDTHALEELYPLTDNEFRASLFYPFTQTASCVILMTAVWPRLTRKYGELSYRLALLEAGHAAQNTLLLATAADVAARPLAGLQHDDIETHLDLNGSGESLIYGIALGTHVKSNRNVLPVPSQV